MQVRDPIFQQLFRGVLEAVDERITRALAKIGVVGNKIDGSFIRGAMSGAIAIGSRLPVLSKTANYTATPSDTGAAIYCNPGAGAFTIALPTAVGNAGVHYHIVNTSGSGKRVTVDPDGSEAINELAQLVLGPHDAIHVSADEAGSWQIL